MLYMMYFAEGPSKTSHYAICTAFMALGMMIPGMFAGALQEWMGYVGFFWWIMGCCLVTLAVTALIKVDPKSLLPPTFRRWDENAGNLLTLRRWNEGQARENGATDAVGQSRGMPTFRR